MRGKARYISSFAKRIRITPAYAGKSCTGANGQGQQQDHPRLCGEKIKLNRITQRKLGSPPPMRGKACPFTLCMKIFWITPAYAGKSRLCIQHRCYQQDHPRLCGEKCGDSGGYDLCPGITPAYAGKRNRSVTVKLSSEDHPRLCGEKRFVPPSAPLMPGSPPPMRGKEGKFEHDRF